MLLADRGYDTDWIREFAIKKGAWANIPPKSNRNDPICFSPHLYRARNLVERFLQNQNSVVASLRATISSPRTTSRSSSLRQSGCGSALMNRAPTHSREKTGS
jgi:transposase